MSKPWLKKYIKPAIYIIAGVVIAFPLFSLAYFTMVRTSTPEFCAICHEIQPAYQAWKTSSHASNSKGIVADCMDCHLPAPHDTFDFFFAKTAHGIKDIVLHFMGDTYDRAAMREQAYANIKNDQCLKCHRNLLYITDNRGAMLAHRATLYPRPGYEKKCFDCHRNLVHVDREQFASKRRDF